MIGPSWRSFIVGEAQALVGKAVKELDTQRGRVYSRRVPDAGMKIEVALDNHKVFEALFFFFF